MIAGLAVLAALAVGVVLARLSALFVTRHLELPQIRAASRLDPRLAVRGAAHDQRRAARTPRPVVWALARAEGRLLLLHPVFLAGVALSAAFVVVAGRDSDSTYWLVVVVDFPLALATLLVVNFAALRSRRDNTEELYGSLAASPIARTAAHLLSAAWAAAAAALLTAATFLYFGGAGEGLVTEEGTKAVPGVLELAQGPVGVVVLGALGLALARWLPSLVAAPVAVVALLQVVPDFSRSSVRLLAFAGFATLFAALALLRHRRSPRLLATGGAAVLVVVLALLLELT